MNKIALIRLVKIIGLCTAAMLVGVLSYVVIVVNEIQLKLEERNIVSNSIDNQKSIIEDGSFIKKSDFLNYMVFTKRDEPVDKILNNLLVENKIEKKNYSQLNIKKALELPKFLGNDCKRYRCLQYKSNFEAIPATIWKGLIGIEDNRFLEHDGVDHISILRAFVADLKAMKLVQGGSTLTMQLAKNLFLTTEKKLERKLREVIYAFYIEYKIPKEEILTTYLNEVFWGVVQGVYIKGVKAASLIYFDKLPEELTDFEAAMLIGMLKGPYFYSPINHLDRLKNRTSVVFNRLKELSLVTVKEEAVWDEEKWNSWHEEIINKNKKTYLRSVYITSKSKNDFIEPFEKFVFYESVKNIQSILKKQTEGLDVAIKFLAIDRSCKSFECEKSFYYYSKLERNLDSAISTEKHQVGSVLKPIIYEQFIELGKKLSDKVSTKPITLNLVSGKWTPKDSSLVKVDEVELRYAIKKSKNIPLVRIATEVGFDVLEPRLKEYFPDLLLPLREYPAQILGAIEMSLSELSFAYLKYFRKTCQNIKDDIYSFEDSILYELSKANETTVSRVSNEVMKNVLIFGKTGTTNNGLDNWYIAFDGKVFYAVWFGVDSDRKDKKLRLAGATSAYRIFQDFQTNRGKQIYELYCD
jgi:penicillin-binding protein 1B